MKNRYGINTIEFSKEVQPYCPMGQAYYNAWVTVKISPDQELFDFMDADSYLQSLSGKELIIEGLVDNVFKHFLDYAPKALQVSVYAESNKHFPVTVTKSL